MKVGLFIPCYINAIYPNVGVASYKLLKSLGVDVDYPLDQTCCGQPMANAGFEDESMKLAFRFEEVRLHCRPFCQLRGICERKPSPDFGDRRTCVPECREDL